MKKKARVFDPEDYMIQLEDYFYNMMLSKIYEDINKGIVPEQYAEKVLRIAKDKE